MLVMIKMMTTRAMTSMTMMTATAMMMMTYQYILHCSEYPH